MRGRGFDLYPSETFAAGVVIYPERKRDEH